VEAQGLDEGEGGDTITGKGSDETTKPSAGLAGRYVWLPVLLPLLLSACLMELLYLAIVALAPLPGLHIGSTPLATAWPWTLTLSRVFFSAARVASAGTFQHWLHLTLLTLTLLSLLACYAFIAWRVNRWRNALKTASHTWLMLLLAGSALFCLTLLFQPALFSDDVFTYIFSGRLLAFYHVDPLNTVPISFPFDPYLQWVVSGRFTPNYYGPLWLYLSSGLVSIGGGPVETFLLFKGVAILAHLVNCVLVWAILAKLAPARRLIGTLLYAWNPLIIVELAGSGHSEGLLLSLLFLGVLLYVQKGKAPSNWQEIAALILFGLAISMNLVVLLIAPLFTWFMVRAERNAYQAFWGFCWRTLIGQGLVIPLYLPFWRGPATFFSITSAIDLTNFSHSLVGLLEAPVEWFFRLVAQWSHFPPVMQPITAADGALRASTIFIFALIYFRLFGKVRNNPAVDHEMLLPGFDVLLDCWAIAVFWYLVLVLGWFWPWYALWVLWIAVLRRKDARTIALLLLSGTALLLYPLLAITSPANAIYQPVLVFGIPLVYMFLSSIRKASLQYVR